MSNKLIAQDILDYEIAVINLAEAKKEEITLRNNIISAFKYDTVEGVQHKTVEGLDIDISITLALTRTLDEEDLDKIWPELTVEQKEVITYKPKLSAGKFKKLVLEGTAGLLSTVVTEKPSQATVKLKFDE